MVTVYFRNGHTAQVQAAAKVEIQTIFPTPGQRDAVAGLACLDSSGNTVGEFRLDDVSGYAVSEQRAARSTSGA